MPAPDPDTIVVGATGMVIDLSAPTEDLVQIADDVIQLQQELRSVRSMIASALAPRMDKLNARTLRVGNLKATVGSPTKIEFDGQLLLLRLTALAEEGLLDESVAEKVVETKVEYEVRKVELNKLKTSPEQAVADVIDECSEVVPQARSIAVTRVAQ